MAVSLVNTFRIAAIEGGVYPPEANWIADRGLHRLLLSRNPSEIPPIIEDTARELCGKVCEAKKSDTGNPHVEKAKPFYPGISEKNRDDACAVQESIY